MKSHASLVNEFEKEFAHRYAEEYGGRSRWPGFKYIANELLKRKHPVILEVGSIRNLDGWTTDGQSTRILDWIASHTSHTRGSFYSFDTSPTGRHIINQGCESTIAVTINGIQILSECDVGDADLIFLDAMDCVGPDNLAPRSWLQHIGFLAACWERLPSGCLIAVDDCIDFKNNTEGKHVYIDRFFKDMGIHPVHSDYLSVWRKP